MTEADMTEADVTEAITYERMTPEEAEGEYPELWLTVTKALPRLTYQEWAEVVSIATDLCWGCHSASSQCQCWNDE